MTCYVHRAQSRHQLSWFAILALVLGGYLSIAGSNPGAGSAQSRPELAIAFSSDRDGDLEVYVMSGDGASQRQLTRNRAADVSPTWAARGRELVFASNRRGDWRLYRMRLDGARQRPLRGTVSTDFDPAASPDGRMIAFESRRDGDLDLYVTPLEGGDARQLAASPLAEENAAWSPDGGRIAFERQDRDGVHLYVVDAAGGPPRQLTFGEVHDSYPAWSADGRRIVFARYRRGRVRLHAIRASGGAARVVVRRPGIQTMPTLSRDKRLAFVDLRGEEETEIVAANGRNLSRSPGDDLDPEFGPRAVPSSAAARIAAAPSCTYEGTPGDDTKTGSSSWTNPDFMCGLGGNDRLYGSNGHDTVKGGGGRDPRLEGNHGNDVIKALEDPVRRDCGYGGPGNGDVIYRVAGVDNEPPCKGPFGNEARR